MEELYTSIGKKHRTLTSLKHGGKLATNDSFPILVAASAREFRTARLAAS